MQIEETFKLTGIYKKRRTNIYSILHAQNKIQRDDE